MRKHEAVRNELDNWARWLVEGAHVGLGFPRAAPFTRLSRGASCTDHAHIPVDDVNARRTHDRVESLRLRRSEWYIAVYCHWIGDPRVPSRRRRPLGNAEAAECMGVALSTFKNHLDSALTDLSKAGGFTH
ncbi:MAG: hypothetical protein LW768_09865 [Rubrivivax sp.]|jgi:hypothetical protein|nr:hypothetical protein [Rubrivivax sp.]